MEDSVERNQLLQGDGTAASSSSPAPKNWLERIYTPKMCLVMFTLINLFTYVDRGAISSTLTPIRSDSTISGGDGVISETKGGMIVSVFMIGYMVACPIFAALGKYVSVRILVATGLAIWTVACAVTGVAQSYAMLVLTRMMVGVGEASFSGYFVTILDNIAPKEQRTLWIGVFYCMIPTGTALGMAAGGAISELEINGIAGWRLVFFLETIIAAPLVIIACLYPSKYAPTNVGVGTAENTGHNAAEVTNGDDAQSLHTAASPASSHLLGDGDSTTASAAIDRQTTPCAAAAPRETEEGEPDDEKAYADPWTAVKHLACNVDYILICIGYGMYVFVTGAIAVWAISMLTNGPWHMSDIAASSSIGGIVAVTGLAGSLLGGIFVDKIGGSQGPAGVAKCLMFGAACMATALPFGIAAMFVFNIPGFIFLFICGVFFIFAITAPINASILSAVRKDVRTYGMSFSTMFIHLIGDFPSPTIAGAIADSFDNGCSDWATEPLCMNATATDCWWVPAKENSNGHCTNEYALRNAMGITFSFIAISVPVWLYASFRANKRAKAEAALAALMAPEDGKGFVNPSAVNASVQDDS